MQIWLSATPWYRPSGRDEIERLLASMVKAQLDKCSATSSHGAVLSGLRRQMRCAAEQVRLRPLL